MSNLNIKCVCDFTEVLRHINDQVTMHKRKFVELDQFHLYFENCAEHLGTLNTFLAENGFEGLVKVIGDHYAYVVT
jgi:hypothetical protein